MLARLFYGVSSPAPEFTGRPWAKRLLHYSQTTQALGAFFRAAAPRVRIWWMSPLTNPVGGPCDSGAPVRHDRTSVR